MMSFEETPFLFVLFGPFVSSHTATVIINIPTHPEYKHFSQTFNSTLDGILIPYFHAKRR